MADIHDKETVYGKPQDPNEEDPAHTDSSIPAGTVSFLGPGMVLNHRYVIEAELGRGGIGVVYLASDTHLDHQPVVVKALLAESDAKEWLLKKFRHESEALQRIQHPGVVRVLDRGEAENGKPYFVMEFIKGQTLRSSMPPRGMTFGVAALFLRQIGQALVAAHEEGVVHRDLKPENIMIQEMSGGGKQVKLIDFGIAKLAAPRSANATTTALAVGTIEYMAPEQIEKGESSPASDLFSLGVMAYEMLTGKRPFLAESPHAFAAIMEVLLEQREGTFPHPRSLRPEIPEPAQAMILKALSYAPSDRPSRVQDFAEGLADALTKPITAPKGEAPPVNQEAETVVATVQRTNLQPSGKAAQLPSLPSETDPPARRWPLIPVAIAGSLLVAALSAALWWPHSGGAPPPGSIGTPPLPVTQRALSYWIEVQKYRNGKPYEKPFIPVADINFEKDYRVRLHVTSLQPGHLYIVNQGPVETNGLPGLNLMFPTPTANQGSSALADTATVHIPELDWFKFDAEAGTEKLWVMWSAKPVPELETIKNKVMTPKTLGVIGDPTDIKVVEDLISQHNSANPNVSKDEGTKRTTVKVAGDPLVYLIKLEHH